MLVTTLCVVMPSGRAAAQADAERPDGIPPERVPIGRGTSIIHQHLLDKTVADTAAIGKVTVAQHK